MMSVHNPSDNKIDCPPTICTFSSLNFITLVTYKIQGWQLICIAQRTHGPISTWHLVRSVSPWSPKALFYLWLNRDRDRSKFPEIRDGKSRSSLDRCRDAVSEYIWKERGKPNLYSVEVLTRYIKNVTVMYGPGDRDLFVIGTEDKFNPSIYGYYWNTDSL